MSVEPVADRFELGERVRLKPPGAHAGEIFAIAEEKGAQVCRIAWDMGGTSSVPARELERAP